MYFNVCDTTILCNRQYTDNYNQVSSTDSHCLMLYFLPSWFKEHNGQKDVWHTQNDMEEVRLGAGAWREDQLG